MKKNLICIILLTILLSRLFFPKHIQHAIVIDNINDYTLVYVNGVKKKINATKHNFSKGTVINYYENMFINFGFTEVPSIVDRIMIKSSDKYELENMSSISLSNNINFYKHDSNNNIKLATSKDLIIGKKNIKCYINNKNKLQTIVIPPIDYSTMRVAISTTNFSSINHEHINLKSSKPIKLYSIRDKIALDIPPNTPISVNKNKNNLVLKINDIIKTFNNRIYMSGSSLIITNIKRGFPSFNPSYNGILEFNCIDKGISVINEVEIEDYLYKVVPSEMPASSNLEALKCQAIAARTYAISDMLLNRFENKGFYVDDSTNSQVYNNMSTQESTTEAINSTKGIIMTFEEKPIDAKYYSTSCGTGVRYKDIWFKSDGTSESRPYFETTNYLTSKSPLPTTEEEWLKFYKNKDIKAIDSTSKYSRWFVEISDFGLTKALNKSLKIIYDRRRDFIDIRKNNKIISDLPQFDKLTDIKILKRSSGGNVLEIAFIFDNMEVKLKGDLNVRSALRCNSNFTEEDTKVISSKKNILPNMNLLPSSFFSIEKQGDKYIILGGGYGHGVGMSQYGAMELAKKNMKYNEILNIYYKNITLKDINKNFGMN